MITDQWFKSVHAWLVSRRRLVTNLFRVAEYGIIITTAVGYYFYVNLPSALLLINQLGRKAGQAAVIFYAVTLIPGILKRFNIFPIIRVSLTLFRRQIGVISFLFMNMHAFYLFFFFFIEQLSWPLLTQRQWFGFAGLWLLVPLWLTSNDWSVKTLGNLWKLLHRLTYIALFFISLHVALINQRLGILLFAVLALVIISWLVFLINKIRQPVKQTPPISSS